MLMWFEGLMLGREGPSVCFCYTALIHQHIQEGAWVGADGVSFWAELEL